MANKIINTKVTESEWNRVKISGASTRPNAKSAYGNGLSASDTKEMFDAPSKLLVDKHNALVDILDAVEGDREANEAERILAEEGRNTGEEKRNQQYLTAEEERNSLYETAEQERNSLYETAEQERNSLYETAEEERNERIAEIEALVGDIDMALDSILAIQESLIGGGA